MEDETTANKGTIPNLRWQMPAVLLLTVLVSYFDRKIIPEFQNRLRVDLASNSPYGETSTMVEEVANTQMEKAAGPERMGPAIYSIIKQEKPKLRYRVGSSMEKLSVLLKKVLPGCLFEKIILGYYHLNIE
ncbi:MAG: hypothetical protein ABFS43_06055 [Thermodesulfobacteriota bacterium]